MTITEEAPAAPDVSVPRGTPHLNAALAAAHAEMPPITKGETADITGLNKDGKPFHKKYSYADLGAICAVANPILGKHGLAFTSKPTIEGGKFVLRYTLLHESGEADSGVMLLPTQAKPQDLGSLLTYYKRYAFCCITGITPVGEDDDAQSTNTEQRFERSAGEAFENATPAPPRNRQQPPQRPAVTVPPLADDDPWKIKIQDIADEAEGAAVRAEVAETLAAGHIDQERANRLNAVITVRALELVAAKPHTRPGSAPPPIRAEDQGAKKPAQAAAADDADWVADFYTRLAAAGEDDLGGLQREVGRAVAERKIQADTAGELASAIRVRRNQASAPVPA